MPMHERLFWTITIAGITLILFYFMMRGHFNKPPEEKPRRRIGFHGGEAEPDPA